MVNAAMEFIDSLGEGGEGTFVKRFPMTPVLRGSMRITDPKYQALYERQRQKEKDGILLNRYD